MAMFVVRKISRARWERRPEFAEGEIPADAVTTDLRTKRNALSFWRCGGGRTADVENVALAIAAAADRNPDWAVLVDTDADERLYFCTLSSKRRGARSLMTSSSLRPPRSQAEKRTSRPSKTKIHLPATRSLPASASCSRVWVATDRGRLVEVPCLSQAALLSRRGGADY